jgi:hypothetical protein
MIPVFERAKTVHALDRAATVIGNVLYAVLLFPMRATCPTILILPDLIILIILGKWCKLRRYQQMEKGVWEDLWNDGRTLIISVTGLSSPNTGKDDDYIRQYWIYFGAVSTWRPEHRGRRRETEIACTFPHSVPENAEPVSVAVML